MKYRIKNETLAKLVYSIFDEEDVQRQIEEQIDEDWYNVKLSSSDFDKAELCETKMNPDYEDLNEDHGSISIFIRKEVIEQVREFDPAGWNHYPEITPPEQKRYLVFTEYEGPNRMKILYWVDLKGWEDEHVIAFRELPEPYKPETQK